MKNNSIFSLSFQGCRVSISDGPVCHLHTHRHSWDTLYSPQSPALLTTTIIIKKSFRWRPTTLGSFPIPLYVYYKLQWLKKYIYILLANLNRNESHSPLNSRIQMKSEWAVSFVYSYTYSLLKGRPMSSQAPCRFAKKKKHSF